MNQTKKRLSIINLAISIGDTETIQLQILKLSPLKSDEKIQEILKGLQAENYAQTQALILDYIENAPDEIIQRTSQHVPLSPEEEEEIIEEFDLFRVKPETEEEEIIDLETLPETAQQEETKAQETNFDAMLNLTSEEILPGNISIEKKTLTEEDDFFNTDTTPPVFNYTEVIEKDDFFQEEEKCVPQDEVVKTSASATLPLDDFDTMIMPAKPEEASLSDETPPSVSEPMSSPIPPADEKVKHTQVKEPSDYEAIPYIDQKLKNMLTQYPPVEIPEEKYPSVDAWLLKISKEGYSEKEVEEIIGYIGKLKEENKKAEAAQLLLVTAATQSKFAQFMLARELFKGELLEKNLPEAFTLINRLALDDDYAEAICDLAQLYEYGIGIDKDKKRAEALYKEAMELGIQRAVSHYERVRRENKGVLGKLFGRK